jgi:hypothetical protein
MPCERPIIGVRACSRALRQRGLELADGVEDLVERAAGLQRQRGVEHVGRRHPEVEPARRLARELLDVGEERDDVVARRRLDLEDARRIELAGRAGRDAIRSAGGHAAGALHRATRGQLDREPQLEAILIVPQRGELGSTVARDHLGRPRLLYPTEGRAASAAMPHHATPPRDLTPDLARGPRRYRPAASQMANEIALASRMATHAHTTFARTRRARARRGSCGGAR